LTLAEPLGPVGLAQRRLRSSHDRHVSSAQQRFFL
jgi:hypothetical protein